MLTADDLTAMRATLVESLPGNAWIERDTLTDDGAGGKTASTTRTTDEPLPYRVAPVVSSSGAESVIGDAVTSAAMFTLTFEAGTDIRPRDRVVDADDGRRFEVSRPLAPRSWAISCRVVATELI